MPAAFDNKLVARIRNVWFNYGQWLDGLSDADYLAELERVRNQGIGNPTP